jgi:hypothetical protein
MAHPPFKTSFPNPQRWSEFLNHDTSGRLLDESSGSFQITRDHLRAERPCR